MNYDKIGDFIATKRKEKGLTQKELADKLGVTDKAVSKWERGLGCPDVSILEILADNLGVSILEVLKGRIIENEIVKITEANDYIKETIDYSNKTTISNVKKVVNTIIFSTVIFIGVLLFIFNINNVIYQNIKAEYHFKDIKKYDEKIAILKDNISKIKRNKGIYEIDDYDEIVKNLEYSFDVLSSSVMLGYGKIKEVSLNDLIYYYNDESFSNLLYITVYRILLKYDESIQKEYDRDIGALVLSVYSSNDSPFKLAYQYKLDLQIADYKSEIERMMKRYEVKFRYNVDTCLRLTELIMKVGGINV